MQDLLLYVTTSMLMVLLVKSAWALIDPETVGARRLPWVAVATTLLALVGVAVQLAWPGAMAALDDDPSKSGWWRIVTAVFMQQGVSGAVFNIVTLALVAGLAEWCWGRPLTLALFAAAILLPHHVNALLGATSGDTDPRNFAGSSGATYFLGATSAAVLLLRGGAEQRRRLLALSVPALGLAAWLVQANAHGLVATEGFAVAIPVWAVAGRLRHPDRDLREPRRATVASLIASIPRCGRPRGCLRQEATAPRTAG